MPRLSILKPTPSPAREAGVTAVESLIVLLIVGLLLGAALPSFGELRDRQRLRAAAALLETDLHYARGLAVAHNEVVRMRFTQTDQGTCYVIHTGPPLHCSCSPDDGLATCGDGAALLRVASQRRADGLELRSNVGSMAFAPATATVTPTGTLRLRNQRDDGVNLVVNIMGRVRGCSPTALAGFPAC